MDGLDRAGRGSSVVECPLDIPARVRGRLRENIRTTESLEIRSVSESGSSDDIADTARETVDCGVDVTGDESRTRTRDQDGAIAALIPGSRFPKRDKYTRFRSE